MPEQRSQGQTVVWRGACIVLPHTNGVLVMLSSSRTGRPVLVAVRFRCEGSSGELTESHGPPEGRHALQRCVHTQGGVATHHCDKLIVARGSLHLVAPDVHMTGGVIRTARANCV